MITKAYIGVGSNVGDRRQNIQRAKMALEQTMGIRSLRSSSVYETEPMGGPPQGMFLNAAWEVETELSPEALLSCLLSIEESLGRKRTEKNAPRTIDLDLLLYGGQTITSPSLQVPHPRFHERWFVLKPLTELASDLEHPVLKRRISDFLLAFSSRG